MTRQSGLIFFIKKAGFGHGGYLYGFKKGENTLKRAIAVVEESSAIEKPARTIMVRAGFGVVTTVLGHRALVPIRDTFPDWALFELYMPHLGGLKHSYLLCASSRHRGILIIIVSSRKSVTNIAQIVLAEARHRDQAIQYVGVLRGNQCARGTRVIDYEYLQCIHDGGAGEILNVIACHVHEHTINALKFDAQCVSRLLVNSRKPGAISLVISANDDQNCSDLQVDFEAPTRRQQVAKGINAIAVLKVKTLSRRV